MLVSSPQDLIALCVTGAAFSSRKNLMSSVEEFGYQTFSP